MSRDPLAEAARRHAHEVPGHILLSAEPAAIPVSLLTLDVLVEQVEDLAADQKYALRAMLNGIDTVDDLQLFLGLSHNDTMGTVAGLLDAEFIDYRPPAPGQERRLTLLDAGREAARDAQSRRPQPGSIPVVYDRLTGVLTGWRKSALTRTKKAKEDATRILLPPSSSKQVQLEDVSVSGLTEALNLRREPIRVLGISAVSENNSFYYDAILLIYKDIDSNTVRLGIEVDGEWSPVHAGKLDDIGAVERLGVTAAPPETPYEEIAESGQAGTRLTRDEVIAIQTALEAADPTAVEAESGKLDRAQIRWLGVYEHPQWLDDALNNSKRRLLIISPWITRSVVNSRFVGRLERLARTADVTIFWGFGDNEKSSAEALADLHAAARRSKLLAIVKVDDTHAKVLVSDGYYIKTSFNWLSFRGAKNLKYRQEEGDLVQDQELADGAYHRYMTQNCGLALEVVGTLPQQYQQLIPGGAAPAILPTASAPASPPANAAPATTTANAPQQPASARTPRRGGRGDRGTPAQVSRAEAAKAALRGMNVGDTLAGVIKSLTDFGAFVNLGAVDGLIHKSELAPRRVAHPSEIVAVDDRVTVTVLRVEVEAGRVGLRLNSVNGSAVATNR